MIDQRGRRALLDGAGRARDAAGLFADASARLRRMIGFQGAAWSATDPGTGLITAPMRVEEIGRREDCFTYWECALLEENVIPFREPARAAVPAAGLRASTGDLPARSAQYRKLLGRQGVGDELRAVFRAGGRPWAVVSLFREKGREPFGPSEISLIASLSAPLADRLRVLARPAQGPGAAVPAGPGLVLFDPSGAPVSVNDEARDYLERLPDGPSGPSGLSAAAPPLPIWLISTAAQARAVAAERDRGAARVRIRTRDGQWLVCHASCLHGPDGAPGPTAMVIQPAAGSDMAPIIAEAYGKTHVSSRGELVARLFAENHWPRRAGL